MEEEFKSLKNTEEEWSKEKDQQENKGKEANPHNKWTQIIPLPKSYNNDIKHQNPRSKTTSLWTISNQKARIFNQKFLSQAIRLTSVTELYCK